MDDQIRWVEPDDLDRHRPDALDLARPARPDADRSGRHLLHALDRGVPFTLVPSVGA